MLQIHLPRKILFGEDSLDFLASLDVHRVVTFVDEIFDRFNPDLMERMESLWREKGVQSWRYFGEGKEPTLAFVKDRARCLVEHEPDLIVAVGGGSVIDAVKVMEVYYEHPRITDAELFDRFNLPPLRRKARFVAIPTTSGTGSEVTPIGVLCVPSEDPRTPLVKKGIADYQLIPDYVLLDPRFTLSMPPAVTVSTAIDAFVHSMEAYVCARPKNAFTDPFALEGMRKVLSYLPKVMEDPGDLRYRGELQIAATMGGLALAGRGSGASHGVGKQLPSLGPVAHGVSVAVMLEAVIRLNAGARLAEYAEIARYLGLAAVSDEGALEGLIGLWRELLDRLGLPRTIEQLGMDRPLFMEKLDSMTKNAMSDAAMKSNPVTPSYDEVRRIFLTLAP
ncbi:iron-containing alcohol dehydrogenase family protein [Aminirod propionatiphilus]|uniref:Iron-containing alcohol dehydrogenase n=1 Tax=Aminirod propionatiphilus TaxID=3415223 RepID=A0ACD1DW80_9BACT|nr:iron-containing alcohol dehydrogenase [Synergistota bacterium]